MGQQEMIKYDYLVVGAGLFGATFAYKAHKKGKKVLVIDKRNHVGGNCHTEEQSGIMVHRYGPHIFHTSNEEVWKFVNQFGTFNNYIHSPLAHIGNEMYNLPFNMNLFSRVFGLNRPDEVMKKITDEIVEYMDLNVGVDNLEDQAISMVGKTIYDAFIKGYTEKQWGKKADKLPPGIIRRLPLRYTYDNNYFDDLYQGIPTEGYTKLIERMLEGADVQLGTEYDKSMSKDSVTIYTGPIDEYFNHEFGPLEYRSLQFVEMEYDTPNFQGAAQINYPTHEYPYTRSIEHKHFAKDNTSISTIVSYEFSKTYKKGMVPYYPIGDSDNDTLYWRYNQLAQELPTTFFEGRLGKYRYYDMDDTIADALLFAKQIL